MKQELIEGALKMSALLRAGKGLAVAAGQALVNPVSASAGEIDRRLAICHACEFLVEGTRCSQCGCTVKWKALLEAWHCPVNKW